MPHLELNKIFFCTNVFRIKVNLVVYEFVLWRTKIVKIECQNFFEEVCAILDFRHLTKHVNENSHLKCLLEAHYESRMLIFSSKII